jgi:hypothetical protein
MRDIPSVTVIQLHSLSQNIITSLDYYYPHGPHTLSHIYHNLPRLLLLLLSKSSDARPIMGAPILMNMRCDFCSYVISL